jgi:hypothetical protein
MLRLGRDAGAAAARRGNKSDALLGAALTAAAVVLYVGNGFLLQSALKSEGSDASPGPFAMVWFMHASMSVLVPAVWVWDVLERVTDSSDAATDDDPDQEKAQLNPIIGDANNVTTLVSLKKRPQGTARPALFSAAAVALSGLNHAANGFLVSATVFISASEANAIFQASIAPVCVSRPPARCTRAPRALPHTRAHPFRAHHYCQ